MSIKRIHAALLLVLAIAGVAIASGSYISTNDPSAPPPENSGSNELVPQETPVTMEDAETPYGAFPDLAVESRDRNAVQIYAPQMPSGELERLCIEVPAKDTGQTLDVYSCDFGPNQKWIVPNDGTVRTQLNPTLCMTWRSSGSAIALDECSFPVGATQTFKFEPTSGRITSADGTLCLNIYADHPDSGTALIGYPCQSPVKRNEVFTTLADPRTYLEISSADPRFSGEVWDQWKGQSDIAVGMESRNGHPNQEWFFEPYGGGYAIHLAREGYCLSPDYSYIAGYYQLITYPCRASAADPAQIFQAFEVGNYVQFKSLGFAPGYSWCISVSTGLGSQGKLRLADCDSSDTLQLFSLRGQPTQATNIVLFNKNELGTLSCLTPSITDNKLTKQGCNTAEEILAATADILPDGSVRFRTTGMCLDDYRDAGSTAAQYECDLYGKENQQFTVTKMEPPDFSVIDPVYAESPVGLRSGSPNTPYLSQSLMNGELVLSESNVITSANKKDYTWLINAQDYVSECINNQHSTYFRALPADPDPDVVISELETLVSRFDQLDDLIANHNDVLLLAYTQDEIQTRRNALASARARLMELLSRFRLTHIIEVRPLWDAVGTAMQRLSLSDRALTIRFARQGLSLRLNVREFLGEWQATTVDGNGNVERIMMQIGNPDNPHQFGYSIDECTAASE